ncbi:Aste57867_9500 [Aphanomyces stellatus]|uniref:Aste57867_9500 protein n=1 Tax=Aphanomyces stellatus TaxID=120398 RepID=A0A485KMY5_9STRA|nr:hypothetical protein As57867_009463 [Aphanomyces stellatus]VFT86379.1 Aste57867_9500 [Aphanomyces stellatus]
MSHFFQKPENALKRANELLNTPNVDVNVLKRQKRDALEVLHEALIAKKNRTWQPTHEELMLTYLNITIDLQLGRIAKDGLHQYRNLVLAQNPASLEKVLLFFVSESEKRAAEARKHSTEISILASVDLESSQTPEAVMMSTTTSEDSADRTDRAVVLPWLRFMWETYRTVLDILRCNTKLEGLYKQVALSAFAFCRNYTRKIEFRRLCEILRTHLYTMQRHEAAPTTQSIRQMRGWEGWSAESVELHLTIRFEQLATATHLDLFTEGFRTIDDIHAIMALWETPPKAAIMATYYKNLAHIFQVSKNHLFHAFAWFKYMTLLQRENLPIEDMALLASTVVLASLSIPLRNHNSILLENPETAAGLLEEKDEHMAALLGFTSLAPPTRRQLLDDMATLHIVDAALPDVAALYHALDRTTIDPLAIVSTIQPRLAAVADHASLHVYVPALEELAVHLVLEQLTHVYSSVTLDHFYKMTGALSMTTRDIEQLIVRSRKDATASIRIRIDHASHCMHFSPVLAMESHAKHMTHLGQKLQAVLDTVQPPTAAAAKVVAATKANMAATRADMLHRRVRIEQQKEAFEKLVQERAKADARKKAEADALRAKQEAERLEAEAKKRELEKIQKIKEDIARKDAKSILAKIGVDASDMDFDTIDKDKLLQDAKEKALKAKEEAQRKLKDAARRLDFIVRATREAENPILEAQFEAKRADEKRVFEETWAATLQKAQEDHKLGLAQKALFDKCAPLSVAFVQAHEARNLEKVRAQLAADALRRQVEQLEQKVDRARTRKADRDQEIRLAEEAERKRVEAEARAERQRLEAEAREAELERQRQEEEEEAERRRREEEAKPKKYVPPTARRTSEATNDEEGGNWSTVPRGGSNRRLDDAFKGRDGPARGFGDRDRGFGGDNRSFRRAGEDDQEGSAPPRRFGGEGGSRFGDRDAAPRDGPSRFGGDREGGSRFGGDREGSSRFGGDREGSSRFGGDREGSSRQGGDRDAAPRDGPSRFGGDREGSSRFGGDRDAAPRDGPSRFGGDREGGSRFGGDREGSSRFGGDREGSSRFGGDREGSSRFGGDREGSSRFGGDRDAAPRDGPSRFGGDREGGARFGGDRDGPSRFGDRSGSSRFGADRDSSFRRDGPPASGSAAGGSRAPDSKWR